MLVAWTYSLSLYVESIAINAEHDIYMYVLWSEEKYAVVMSQHFIIMCKHVCSQHDW